MLKSSLLIIHIICKYINREAMNLWFCKYHIKSQHIQHQSIYFTNLVSERLTIDHLSLLENSYHLLFPHWIKVTGKWSMCCPWFWFGLLCPYTGLVYIVQISTNFSTVRIIKMTYKDKYITWIKILREEGVYSQNPPSAHMATMDESTTICA